MTKHQCPACGLGALTQSVEYVEYTYKNRTNRVPEIARVCDHCGSELSGPAEMRQTKRAIQAFKKQVDGLLCGVEIAAIRKQYGLSQDQAARLCGGGPVAFSKYENDDVVQSESMDSLLRLIRKSSDAFWSLVAEKGLRDELVKVTPVSVQVVGGHLRMTLTSEQPNPSYTPHDFRRAQSPVENVKCQG